MSVYGASAESYDGLTRRPGSYKTFMKGLQAAHEADDMKALAARFGVPTKTYSHITPTIYGGAETLPSQSRRVPRPDDGPQALPRLRRRTDHLPRQPARHGAHVQGRP
ncbi:MAG: hypothetical protein ACRDQ4_04030 [Pseudonocardiaceae bacterium]